MTDGNTEIWLNWAVFAVDSLLHMRAFPFLIFLTTAAQLEVQVITAPWIRLTRVMSALQSLTPLVNHHIMSQMLLLLFFDVMGTKNRAFYQSPVFELLLKMHL